eukprot:1094473-Pelagomonas_calceolata.AAC.3
MPIATKIGQCMYAVLPCLFSIGAWEHRAYVSCKTPSCRVILALCAPLLCGVILYLDCSTTRGHQVGRQANLGEAAPG